MKNYISQIKQEASNLQQKTDEELLFIINKIKKRVKNESLNNVLVEWYAIVQEISARTIGLRHFDTQLLAGIYLHEGKIVEMKTGEGKTLSSTLPVALNALSKKGVHVVTVNDYLAERDKNWMGKVYKGLGLTVGLVKSNSDLGEKRKNYQSDITYLTNSELVFDYLRDSSSFYMSEIVQRSFNYCILDEIDSILIDEARTPLILSTVQGETNVKKLHLAKEIAELLEKELHFELDEKRREINLTEKGYQEVKLQLGKQTLYDLEDPWILEILNALKAKYVFKLNKDYIVLKNKIIIVDEFTGRVMEDRRWSLGIHEAIEVKENVQIGDATKTKSSITYQNFFPLYPKLAGMTGTAMTEAGEFSHIYKLDTVSIPTNRPLIRVNSPDIIYKSEKEKFNAACNEIEELYKKGKPVLVGTISIEKSERLSAILKRRGIPHNVLNAKYHEMEATIISQAGRLNAVTIATNMAGRGTDILLGGNPEFMVNDWLKAKGMGPKDVSQEEREKWFIEAMEKVKEEHEKVVALGGLHIMGTERHESRRIDNQLRGRSGRQGDPGFLHTAPEGSG